jgi:hypothetical protein
MITVSVEKAVHYIDDITLKNSFFRDLYKKCRIFLSTAAERLGRQGRQIFEELATLTAHCTGHQSTLDLCSGYKVSHNTAC